MKPSTEQHNDFLAHKKVPSVTFEHNAYVRVLVGEHASGAGSIVSVEELGNDPLYLIELESGKDALIHQSHIELVSGEG